MSILVSPRASLPGGQASRSPYQVLDISPEECDPKAIEEAALRCSKSSPGLSADVRVGMCSAAERNRSGPDHAPRPGAAMGIRSRSRQGPRPGSVGAPAAPAADGGRRGSPRTSCRPRERLWCQIGVPGRFQELFLRGPSKTVPDWIV